MEERVARALGQPEPITVRHYMREENPTKRWSSRVSAARLTGSS